MRNDEGIREKNSFYRFVSTFYVEDYVLFLGSLELYNRELDGIFYDFKNLTISFSEIWEYFRFLKIIYLDLLKLNFPSPNHS